MERKTIKVPRLQPRRPPIPAPRREVPVKHRKPKHKKEPT
jgi:hypothetical protein